MAKPIAIIAGASEFPNFRGRFEGNGAFAQSAQAFIEYLKDPSCLGLDDDLILDLFDHDDNAYAQYESIGTFLRKHENSCEILIFFYTGHGGFYPPEHEFFLAIKSTKQSDEHFTGLAIKSLAKTLNDRTRDKALLLILDCCFAGTAVKEFQGGQITDVVATQASNHLPKGTAVLAAASKDKPALTPFANLYTMFSDAFLHALRIGKSTTAPLLSLREIGELTESIIQKKYGADGVRPELHEPRQLTGSPADLAIFPNPSQKKDTGAFRAGMRLNLAVASQVVNSASERDVQQLEELVFAYELHNAIGNVTNVTGLLNRARRLFTLPVLISKDTADVLLKAAEALDRERGPVSGWQSQFQHSSAVLNAIMQGLPSSQECLAQIFRLPRELYIPFLVRKFYIEESQSARDAVLDIIFRSEPGIESERVLEEIIRNGTFGESTFAKAVAAARRIIGSEFEQWYFQVRDRSYDEENSIYQRALLERSIQFADRPESAPEHPPQAAENIQEAIGRNVLELQRLNEQIRGLQYQSSNALNLLNGPSTLGRYNFASDMHKLQLTLLTLTGARKAIRNIRTEFEGAMDLFNFRSDEPTSKVEHGEHVKIGDQVLITSVPQQSRELPMGFIQWTPAMNKFCGRRAKVTAISQEGVLAVRLDVDLGKWWWSPDWLAREHI